MGKPKKRKKKPTRKLLPSMVVDYWKSGRGAPGIWEELSIAVGAKPAGIVQWPDECALPVGVAYTLLSDRLEPRAARNLCSQLTGAWAWDQERVVYRFDPTLARELIGQADADPDARTIPAELLSQLPHRCFFVEIKETPIIDCPGFFCWTDYDFDLGSTVLRFLLLRTKDAPRDIGFLTAPIVLQPLRSSASTEEGKRERERLCQDAPKVLAKTDPGYQPGLEMLQFVLYLLSVNAETSPAADGATLVGKQAGRKLRAAPSAHIRRAHWHRYWVGSKNCEDRHLEQRWIPPIPVGRGEPTPKIVKFKRSKDEL